MAADIVALQNEIQAMMNIGLIGIWCDFTERYFGTSGKSWKLFPGDFFTLKEVIKSSSF